MNVWVTSAAVSILNRLLIPATFIALAHKTNLEILGTFSWATTLSFWIYAVANLGTDVAIVRATKFTPSEFSSLIQARLAFSIGLILIANFYMQIDKQPNLYVIITNLIFLSTFLQLAADGLDALHLRMKSTETRLKSSVLANSSYLVLLGLVMQFLNSPEVLVLAVSILLVVKEAIRLKTLRYPPFTIKGVNSGFKTPHVVRSIQGVMRLHGPIIFINFLALFASRFDAIIIGTLLPLTNLAEYSGSYLVITAFQGLVASLGLVLLGTLKEDLTQVNQILRRYLSFGFVFGTSVFLLAEPLAGLIFGDFRPDVQNCIQLLSIAIPFMAINSVLLRFEMAKSHDRTVIRALSIATASSVITNLMLIPHIGLLAAAYVTVQTEVVITFFLLGKQSLGKINA